MNWVWECSNSVGNDRLVLLAIADRAGDDGYDSWPSVKSLARKTKLHERTVQRCLRNLEALGELESDKANGPYGTNLYAVRMDSLVLNPTSRPNRKKPPRQLVTGGKLPPGDSGAVGGMASAPPPGGVSAVGEVASAPPNTSTTPLTTSTSRSSTAASPRISPAEEPSKDGNFSVIEKLAFDLLKAGSWEWNGEVFMITNESELAMAVRDECARLRIDYGRHPGVALGVVQRACASEWKKRGREKATA